MLTLSVMRKGTIMNKLENYLGTMMFITKLFIIGNWKYFNYSKTGEELYVCTYGLRKSQKQHFIILHTIITSIFFIVPFAFSRFSTMNLLYFYEQKHNNFHFEERNTHIFLWLPPNLPPLLLPVDRVSSLHGAHPPRKKLRSAPPASSLLSMAEIILFLLRAAALLLPTPAPGKMRLLGFRSGKVQVLKVNPTSKDHG